MKTVAAFLFATVACAASRTLHPADKINAMGLTWKAYPQDWARSYPMGVKENAREVHQRELDLSVKEVKTTIPASFDAREKWPECNETIGNIRDQSRCGSCWAVSTASSFSDRMCVASGGKDYAVSYSADDTMSCCTGSCGDGCAGGWPGMAWKWFVSTGVVTGGNYTDKWGCQPYPFPPHASGNFATPFCKRTCQNDWTFDTYLQDKAHAKTAFRLPTKDVEQMQLHLMEGTLVVTFAVYTDFFDYKSGVYQKSPTAQYSGMHAVRLIGWGVENEVPYWLIANSWDKTWGDHGYFKIIRGVNECGIEEDTTGGEVVW